MPDFKLGTLSVFDSAAYCPFYCSKSCATTFITNQHLPSAMPGNTQVLKSCRSGILWHHPHTCINHLCIAQALTLMLTKWLEVVGYYFMMNKTRKITSQQFYSHQICRIDEPRIPGIPISICHHGGLSNLKN